MPDINLHFFCRIGHTYKNGLNPIVLRITYRTERKDILTGLSCSKENRVADLQQVRSDQKFHSSVNKELFSILHKVRERFHEFKNSQIEFTMDELVKRIRGKEVPPQTLIEYTNLKLLELKDIVGMDPAVSTFYKYQRIARIGMIFYNSDGV